MVYTFKALRRRFALDTESGSVLKINSLTQTLIEKRKSPLNKQGDFLGYSHKEIEQAEKEIDELINRGLLFSKAEEYQKPPYSGEIKALCLNISHNCSLACEYCFAGGGEYSGEYGGHTAFSPAKNMDIKTAKAAIDFLIEKSGRRRNLEVDFFGGEPLLNLETVKETVAYARLLEKQYNKNFRFTVTTNGLGLNEDIIDFFNKEMQNVVISIDGRKNTHDSVRKRINGQGSFEQILKNALKFKEKRGDRQYYIRGTYTQKNKDFAADVIALNDLGFDQISLEPVVLPQNHPLSLNNEDINQLKHEYETLAWEYLKRRKGKNPFNFFHFNIDFKGGPCIKKRLSGCGAGSEYLAVSPDGTLYPCHRFDGNPQFKIGNVFNKSLNLTLIQKFYQADVNSKKDCDQCFCRYFCSGGCAANAIEFSGDINAPHRFSCELMKKRAELSMAIYAVMQEKIN